MTDYVALAEVAFDGAKVEDVVQLTKDGLTLWSAYSKLTTPNASLDVFSETDLDGIIPALSRSGIVLGDIWGDETKRATVMAALKGLGT